MKLEIKRDAILIIPESECDRAFIEDTMKLNDGACVELRRVNNVSLGYAKGDEFCLKASAPR